MKNIVITYAVEKEKVCFKNSNFNIIYVQTGIGKVNATLETQSAIIKHNPEVIINIGTAGSINHSIDSVHLCNRFIDRDMKKIRNNGDISNIDISSLSENSILKNIKCNSICNTGDTFLTSKDGTGDVFDMEAFASAKVCEKYKIPFLSVKCVTDIIGDNSIGHWKNKLNDANKILQKQADELSLLIDKKPIKN